MNEGKRLIFYIDAYSPETFPMAKLAEYLADYAALLGKEHAVHFAGLAKGSTKIAACIEFEDMPKVRARLSDIRRGTPPKDAAKIFMQIDNRLANDNAIGRIFFESDDKTALDELLTFPGRDRPKAQSYGPFTQEGSLDGILISVGGKDETISIRLQNGDVVYSSCETTRIIAREMGKHLFEPIRIYGTGRWTREPDGEWALHRFKIDHFDVLGKDTLRHIVADLRATHGSGWKDLADPLTELVNLRREEDKLH